MGIRDLWENLLGIWRQAPKTRLSRDEVIQIARTAMANDPERDSLTMTHVIERGGALVWIVGQPVVGRRVWVEIDDGTGNVLHIGSGGSR